MAFTERLTVVKVSGTLFNENDGKPLERMTVMDELVVELTKIISQNLNIKFKIINSSDRRGGDLLPNGTWTGMIRMLQRAEADIAMYIAVREDRFKAVDYTYPLQMSRITFLTRKPEYLPEVTTFFKPFSLAVWGMFAVSLIMMIISLSIILKKFRFQNTLLYLYGAVLKQNNFFNPKNMTEFVSMACWIFGIAFFVHSYEAVLLSFMTFPPLSGVRTIPELATAIKKNEYYCITWPGVYTGHALAKSIDLNSKIIGENLQRNKGTIDFKGVMANKKVIKKPAFIAEKGYLSVYSHMYFVSDDSFFSQQLAIAMKKEFHYKEQLNSIVSYLWSSGLLQKIESDALSREYAASSSNNEDITIQSPRSLSIEDLRGIFYFVIIGHTLSIIIFLFEVFIKKVNL